MNRDVMDKYIIDLIEEIRSVSLRIWVTPQELERNLCIWLNKNKIQYEKVIVLGNMNNVNVFVVFKSKHVVLITPNENINNNSILKELNLIDEMEIGENSQYCYLTMKNQLNERLRIPKVVLVNLCNVTLRPVPRLNLSTASLASYLRYRKSAEVFIIDMQFGETVSDVISKCIEIKPDLIGLSVDFKEQSIAEELINGLLKSIEKSKIVLGNIIPSLLFEDFLKKYSSILISYGEGENSWYDLTRYIKGSIGIEQVSGIKYVKNNKIIVNKINYINMRDSQTPALDTIHMIEKHNGVLTLETSRGCDYSACTFCPRQHKTDFWRCLSEDQVVDQIKDLLVAAEYFNIPKHIFLADEEFIGELENDKGTDRIINICEKLLASNQKFKLDAAARADSVYDPDKSVQFNVKTLKMWHLLKKIGLDRLFIGIESGSLSQLKRFGKGTTPEQNIIALRLLTALGIDVRIGFIMFDPLMEDLNELVENINFLDREDAILNPIVDQYAYKELYTSIVNDQEFVHKYSQMIPTYSFVSYMISPLEVLINSSYSRMVQNFEKNHNIKLIYDYDLEMGKLKSRYINSKIENMNKVCDKWVSKNYSLMYTLKSLAKRATSKEKMVLYDFMHEYRQISHYMSICLINLYKEIKNRNLIDYANQNKISIDLKNDMEILNEWNIKALKPYVNKILSALEEKIIYDTFDKKLVKVIQEW